MKHFVIIGSTLSGNKGAAAMLESAMQTLGREYPGSHFTLLSYLPVERERALNPYKRLTILKASPLYLGLVINPLALLYAVLPPLRGVIRKNKQIAALAQADALLDQGGITFVDGREKFLLYNIASILPALLLKTKVVKCSQALGPFNGRINRFAAKLFLPKMAAIMARGGITEGYLRGLGLTNVTLAADYAFLLELSDKDRRAANSRYIDKMFLKGEVIGVAPSVVMQHSVAAAGKDYAAMLAVFINQLNSRGKKVLLIPHSVRVGTQKTHNNDMPLCYELMSRIADKDMTKLIGGELSSQELRALIANCDLFVASRFHAMISSLAMEVPTLVIGWSHKYKEVLEMFELEEWAIDSSDLSVKKLSNKLSELEGQSDVVRQKLRTKLPKVKALSRRQVAAITQLIR